mmetsp:Transcript_10170/g.28604  ORF Transcript_10170/g.28604 Transcript_10170/m.28604 type:complete len:249 (-) Transcript_10170:172-918(-)
MNASATSSSSVAYESTGRVARTSRSPPADETRSWWLRAATARTSAPFPPSRLTTAPAPRHASSRTWREGSPRASSRYCRAHQPAPPLSFFASRWAVAASREMHRARHSAGAGRPFTSSTSPSESCFWMAAGLRDPTSMSPSTATWFTSGPRPASRLSSARTHRSPGLGSARTKRDKLVARSRAISGTSETHECAVTRHSFSTAPPKARSEPDGCALTRARALVRKSGSAPSGSPAPGAAGEVARTAPF